LSAVTVDEVAGAAAEFLAPSKLVGVAVGDASLVVEPLSRITEVEVATGA
jgi:hypothetical protein